MKLALILWVDANSNSSQRSLEEIMADRDCLCYSGGLLVADDEIGVTLALEHFPEYGDYRHTLNIPKEFIVEKRIYG